nr:hypothetical protein Itr_chr13CG14060 [Ipomoea trifida]
MQGLTVKPGRTKTMIKSLYSVPIQFAIHSHKIKQISYHFYPETRSKIQ